ncbi:MAG: MBL fold metallo-hydrolase [Candidatus Hodarchaeota archaeon]
MKIRFLGTSASIPTISRTTSSILVNDDLLLDCGEGTTQKLLNLNPKDASLERIKTIAITHSHADHIAGLIAILWTMWLSGRISPLRIIGPDNVKDSIDRLLKCVNTPIEAFKFRFDVEIMKSGEKRGELSTLRTIHSPVNLAYRIERKGGVCYTGDTAPFQKLARFAERCTILIHECSFPDELAQFAHEHKHSTPKDAATVAKDADVDRLVLTHWWKGEKGIERKLVQQARKIFDGKVILARDLLSVDI